MRIGSPICKPPLPFTKVGQKTAAVGPVGTWYGKSKQEKQNRIKQSEQQKTQQAEVWTPPRKSHCLSDGGRCPYRGSRFKMAGSVVPLLARPCFDVRRRNRKSWTLEKRRTCVWECRAPGNNGYQISIINIKKQHKHGLIWWKDWHYAHLQLVFPLLDIPFGPANLLTQLVFNCSAFLSSPAPPWPVSWLCARHALGNVLARRRVMLKQQHVSCALPDMMPTMVLHTIYKMINTGNCITTKRESSILRFQGFSLHEFLPKMQRRIRPKWHARIQMIEMPCVWRDSGNNCLLPHQAPPSISIGEHGFDRASCLGCKSQQALNVYGYCFGIGCDQSISASVAHSCHASFVKKNIFKHQRASTVPKHT